MFSFHQLKYFVSAIDHGSITKAAKELFISQPALTKQLSELEKVLNCQLVVRKTTGIELTEAGRFFYEKAWNILKQVEHLQQEIKQYGDLIEIRLGALPSIASFYLPDVLKRMCAIQNIRFEILTRNTTQELLELINENRIDIAFLQDLPKTLQLHHLHLFREPYLAILPLSHPLASKLTIRLDELVTEKMILYKNPCDIRTTFRHSCQKLGIEPSIAFELDSNESIIGLVSKGNGVSFVPQMVAANIHDPSIVKKEIRSPAFNRTIDIVFQPQFKHIAQQIQRP
jgi:DNA-binding transcriptional LysR family regulator